MQVLKFNISGFGASFSRPHFNSVISSYSHIHKVALLGLIGAIIGIDKINDKKDTLPSFYRELKDFELAIVPKEEAFNAKYTTITNTTGFANKNSTLLFEYEYLIRPSWDIYIVENDSVHYSKLKNMLLNKETVYTPFLGRNHWFADINDVELLEGKMVSDAGKIDGLFKLNDIEIEECDFDMDFDEESSNDIFFKEYMPTSLTEEKFIQYNEEKLAITNRNVLNIKKPLLNCNSKNLYLL